MAVCYDLATRKTGSTRILQEAEATGGEMPDGRQGLGLSRRPRLPGRPRPPRHPRLWGG
jgi:hypothetical protein